MYYLMMDVDSGNLVDEFDRLDEALCAVRDAFARFGEAGLQGLAVSTIDDVGGSRLVGIGAELLRLAATSSPARLGG